MSKRMQLPRQELKGHILRLHELNVNIPLMEGDSEKPLTQQRLGKLWLFQKQQMDADEFRKIAFRGSRQVFGQGGKTRFIRTPKKGFVHREAKMNSVSPLQSE